VYKTGVFPGKFFPPHRGHLHAAINAATQCEKLYVVVSDNMDIADQKCKECGIRPLPLEQRARWMAQELKGIEHIQVLMLNEDGIPPYPEGTKLWSKKLVEVMPEKFDAIFGGEPEYQETYMQNFPKDVKYVLYDYSRTRYPICGTIVRDNPLQYWDYILGAARQHFAKRILITGTESCGKTTLVRYLAKIYHTSWTEEYGRQFIDEELGGCGEAITPEDFVHIARSQRILEEEALKNANRVVFFDSDAVATYYYAHKYLGKYIDELKMYIDPNRYDKVLLCSPNVPWVADGQRFLQNDRYKNHKYMESMYKQVFGFNNIVSINENDYKHRLEHCIQVIDRVLDKEKG